MKLLFICTHNRCRSILAEAITRAEGGTLIEAASAGSQPAGEVHPLTLHYLQQQGIEIAGLHSKGWDTLTDFMPDFVITVCDSAAGESCPLWLGHVPKIHWGLADPSASTADSGVTARAFVSTINTLKYRVLSLATLLARQPAMDEVRLLLESLADKYVPAYEYQS